MDRAFDRVLFARHFALCVGVVAAWLFHSEWRIGYLVLWFFAIGAALNFLAFFFQTRPSMATLCRVASPIIGVGSWSALIAVTNGVSSPFIPGLWLEVGLSAMSQQLRGVLLVGVGAFAALWIQQIAFVGLEGRVMSTVLQSGFLAGGAIATYLVTRRWTHRQSLMSRAQEELGARMDALTEQLENERIVAAVGENVARLAHGLKNAVHSLRGFASLIEPKLADKAGSEAALAGLRAAIDDLEVLAHMTLGSGDALAAQEREGWAAGAKKSGVGDVRRGKSRAPVREDDDEASALPSAVSRVLRELGPITPGIRWETKSDGANPPLSLDEASLAETLVILLRNSVEAMEGRGHVLIETWQAEGALHIVICDEGPGFQVENTDLVFKPGFTTKPQGSGYGLFLAKRMIEEHGGEIRAENRASGGARISVRVPVGDE